ncbi:MAG TPA: class A beta-lactamase, partial [Sphingomicrobium sp.]|nr:class A beta-lactamase [Sphingomicrobium sp.]
FALNAPASAASLAAVQSEIANISKSIDGVVGVAAWRLDGRGVRVLVNADQEYPMASTFKVPIAGTVLSQVDSGRLKLDQMVPVDPNMMVDSEGLAETFRHPGVTVSVENLLELMLTVSDNTATDTLEKLVGGPGVVTQWVRRQGIVGLRVDRDTAGMIRDFYGLPPGPSFPASLEAGLKANPNLEDKGDKPDPAFDNDPRDTSSPTAMAELFERIYSGKALSPASTNLLREIQERNTTGKARIRARLPQGTIVAEKTGTIGGTVNNVGVITLPGNAGKLIVAVFIKKSSKPVEDRERVIADISRALYDYYLFEAP